MTRKMQSLLKSASRYDTITVICLFDKKGLELFSRLYPQELAQVIPQIQQIISEFIVYDPYYVGDDDGDEEMGDASEFE